MINFTNLTIYQDEFDIYTIQSYGNIFNKKKYMRK